MLKLIIEDDEGRKTVVPFVRDEMTIGRQDGNTIRLTERNVSRRHARLRRINGHVLVEDMGSAYGIRINGERIRGETPLRDGDLLQIGDYDCAIQAEAVDLIESTLPVAKPLSADEAAAALAEAGEEIAGEAELADRVSATDTPTLEVPTSSVLAPGAVPYQSSMSLGEIGAPDTDEAESVSPEVAPRLLVLNTELAGREFACIRTDLKIGRADENDITVDHRSLSRVHARLVRESDGAWTLLDMESANGVLVNGERLGRVALRSGDVVELGHVKLRFLKAGERGELGGRQQRRSGALRVTGIIALVVVLAAAGVAVWKPQLLERLLPAATVVEGTPGAPTTPPEGPPDRQGTAPAQVATQDAPEPQAVHPPTPPPSEPIEAPVPSTVAAAPELKGAALKRLEAAQQALSARDFDRARSLLEGYAPDPIPPQAQPLLERARAEAGVRHSLSEAQKLMDAEQILEAEAMLAKCNGTQAYGRELTIMKARLATARTAWEQKRQAQEAQDSADRTARATEVQALYEAGRDQLKKNELRKAESTFKKCLEVDAKAAYCHLALGGTYARMPGKAQLGATFYRKFLDLAPEDPAAPQVKKRLEEYEKALRTTSTPE